MSLISNIIKFLFSKSYFCCIKLFPNSLFILREYKTQNPFSKKHKKKILHKYNFTIYSSIIKIGYKQYIT